MTSTEAVLTTLYLGIVVMSLGAGGGATETCDIFLGDCEGRTIAFIVFSFFAAFLAAPPFVANLFDLFSVKKLDIFFAPGVLLCSLIATAIGSSPRTDQVAILFVLLSWFSLWTAAAAVVLTLKNPNSTSSQPFQGTSDDRHSTTVPLTDGIRQAMNTAPVATAATSIPVPAPHVTLVPQAPPEPVVSESAPKTGAEP